MAKSLSAASWCSISWLCLVQHSLFSFRSTISRFRDTVRSASPFAQGVSIMFPRVDIDRSALPVDVQPLRRSIAHTDRFSTTLAVSPMPDLTSRRDGGQYQARARAPSDVKSFPGSSPRICTMVDYRTVPRSRVNAGVPDRGWTYISRYRFCTSLRHRRIPANYLSPRAW